MPRVMVEVLPREEVYRGIHRGPDPDVQPARLPQAPLVLNNVFLILSFILSILIGGSSGAAARAYSVQ